MKAYFTCIFSRATRAIFSAPSPPPPLSTAKWVHFFRKYVSENLENWAPPLLGCYIRPCDVVIFEFLANSPTQLTH